MTNNIVLLVIGVIGAYFTIDILKYYRRRIAAGEAMLQNTLDSQLFIVFMVVIMMMVGGLLGGFGIVEIKLVQ